MKKLLVILFLFIGLSSYSQSNWKGYKELPGPVKGWVVFHVFKAKRALKVSQEARSLSDSIAKTNLLDGNSNGGQIDAFRHAYWMASLKQCIGEGAARSLGKAYERAGYKLYKKKRLEDGEVPDKIASEMDLYNNEIGLSLVKRRETISKQDLIQRIVTSIKKGKFKVIKRDKKKQYLTCKGQVIPYTDLKGKWENNKCLISSDQN